MIALHREETGVLAMKLSENFWPEDLELAVLAVHDICEISTEFTFVTCCIRQ